MAKELMEIGGFITEGAEIVNHDNSLSGNGTVDSPLGVVPGYNETVLWSGNTNSGTLSEPISAFEYAKFYCRDDAHRSFIIDVAGTHSAAGQTQLLATSANTCSLRTLQAEITGTNFAIWGAQFGFNGSTTAISWMNGRNSNSRWTVAEKVIGINRIANN